MDSKVGVLRGPPQREGLRKACWMSMSSRAVGVVDADFMMVVIVIISDVDVVVG